MIGAPSGNTSVNSRYKVSWAAGVLDRQSKVHMEALDVCVSSKVNKLCVRKAHDEKVLKGTLCKHKVSAYELHNTKAVKSCFIFLKTIKGNQHAS